MDQPPSGRRASAPRRKRRSLAEFALPASGAPVVKSPASAPAIHPASAVPPEQHAVKPPDKRRKKITPARLHGEQQVAASSVHQAKAPAAAMPEPALVATPVAKVADDYLDKAFELMNANINATMEFAQRLASVRTPTELSELSTRHAQRQMELIVKQTAELGSIAQRLATSHVRRMTAGFAKGERKK